MTESAPTPPEPAPAITALIDHFVAEEVEVRGVTEDGLTVWIDIDLETELDPAGDDRDDTAELGDLVTIGVHFLAPERDEPRWFVSLETPAIEALGRLGDLLEVIPTGDDCGWQLQAEDGEVVLDIGELIDMTPEAGFAVCADSYQLFLAIVADFSPSGLRFADRRSEAAGVRSPGFWEVNQAEAALAQHRYREAQRLLEAATEHFAMAGLHDHRLAATTGAAMMANMDGEPRTALAIVEQCLREVPGPDETEDAKVDAEQTGLRAQMLWTKAMCHYQLTEWDEADLAFSESGELAGSDRLDMLHALSRIFDPAKAAGTVRQLETEHRNRAGRDPMAEAEGCLALSVHHRRLGDFERAAADLEEADRLLASIGEADLRTATLADLCLVRITLRDTELARESLDTLRSLPAAPGLPPDYREGLIDLISRFLGQMSGDGPLPGPPVARSPLLDRLSHGWAELMSSVTQMEHDIDLDGQMALLDRMADLIEPIDDGVGRAVIQGDRARHRLQHAGQNPSIDILRQASIALDESLEAIRSHDAVRHQLTNSADRSRWLASALPSYEDALLLASSLERDPALMAELLTRIRVLGTPDVTTAEGGQLPVTEPPHVTIDGRSRLAPPGAVTERLREDRRDAQAGPDAWWWSMWQSDQAVFWATMSPSAQVEAGTVDLDPEAMAQAARTGLETIVGSPLARPLAAMVKRRHFDHGPLGEHLQGLEEALLGGERRPDGEIEAAWGPDGLGTEDLLATVGRLLVPPPLQQALRSATRTEPLRLLVEPAPSLSWLPLGLLAVDLERTDRPVNLIERAVIQLARPVPLPAHGDPVAAGPEPILAVLDPSDDLGPVRRLAGRATSVLAGPVLDHDLGSDSDGLATVERTLQALSGPPASDSGTFLYAGHAVPGSETDPLDGGLRLGSGRRGAVLTVGQVIGRVGELRVPPRVVLCGCSTGAERAPREQERWGLTGAFMLGGARAVVASAWDLLACEATTAFVDRLLDAMAEHDVPEALREAQLAMLDWWRYDLVAGRHQWQPDSAACHHPVLWAGFVAFGRVGPPAGAWLE